MTTPVGGLSPCLFPENFPPEASQLILAHLDPSEDLGAVAQTCKQAADLCRSGGLHWTIWAQQLGWCEEDPLDPQSFVTQILNQLQLCRKLHLFDGCTFAEPEAIQGDFPAAPPPSPQASPKSSGKRRSLLKRLPWISRSKDKKEPSPKPTVTPPPAYRLQMPSLFRMALSLSRDPTGNQLGMLCHSKAGRLRREHYLIWPALLERRTSGCLIDAAIKTKNVDALWLAHHHGDEPVTHRLLEENLFSSPAIRDVSWIRSLQSLGLDINQERLRICGPITPLGFATARDDNLAVKALIEAGAKLNQNHLLPTALMQSGDETVKILIDAGATLSPEDCDWLTLILNDHWSRRNGRCFERIAEHMPYIFASHDVLACQAFIWAIENKKTDLLTSLYRLGLAFKNPFKVSGLPDWQTRSCLELGRKILEQSIKNKNTELLKVMLQFGVQGDSDLLNLSIMARNSEATKLLCETAPSTYTAYQLDKALHNAVTANSAGCLEVLLDAGAAVHTVYGDLTPLQRAAAAGSYECTKMLLRKGASPFACSDSGENAISLALKSREPSAEACATWLCAHGQGSLQTNELGELPMDLALKHKKLVPAFVIAVSYKVPWPGKRKLVTQSAARALEHLDKFSPSTEDERFYLEKISSILEEVLEELIKTE